MHVTLAQYNLLTRAEKREVTSIDARVVDQNYHARQVIRQVTADDFGLADAWDDETCGSIPNPEYGR